MLLSEFHVQRSDFWFHYTYPAIVEVIFLRIDRQPEPDKSKPTEGGQQYGSFRDLDMIAPEFQLLGVVNPSHAFVHIVDWGRPVTVHGMAVQHDEVVHADRHGAVTIPAHAVKAIPAAIELLTRKEAVILEMARRPDFDIGKLREALQRSEDIH